MGQAPARDLLVRGLRNAGREGLANQIAQQTPEAIAQKNAQKEAAENDKAAKEAADKAARDKATADQKALTEVKRKARAALGDFKRDDAEDNWDDQVAKWANAASSDLEESFAKAKKQIAQALTIRLKNKGVATLGAEDEIDSAASVLADQAFNRVGRLEARDAKARKTAQTKQARAAGVEIDALTRETVREGQAATKQGAKVEIAGVGDQYQEEYERQLANNLAIAAQGGPVARNRAQEARLRRQGVEYALPEDEARKRLQADMQAGLRNRGATPEAAQLAAKQIAERGDIALQKQLGEAQGTNQQKLMQVAAQHNATLAALINRQQAQAMGIDGLLRDASQLRGQTDNTGTALNFGRR